MAKDFALNPTCSFKFNVMMNRDGNVAQPGDNVAGLKSVNFSGFKSDITIDDAINTEDSTALHNGVAGLMWLLSGTDENFDELSVKKTTVEVVEED